MGVTVGAKTGVKTWGEREPPLQAAPQLKSMSAHDSQKIGGEDIGEVLNKLADANYVDPSKRMRTVGNDKLDKDAFFKLMLTQLKNQDPSNPLKSHEMAAQLASFSSLEQMTNINETLQDLKAGQKPMEQYQVLNLIGKAIAGDSSKVVRGPTDRYHDFEFELPTDADQMVVKVRGPEGNVVRKLEFKNLKQGANQVSWNGTDDKGAKLPQGEYQFMAEALSGDGKKLHVTTEFEGVITGVNYTTQGPVLLVGNKTVKMADIKKIIDPSTQNKDQKIVQVVKEDLQSQAPAAENRKVEEKKEEDKKVNERAEQVPQDLMKTVGLSSEIKDRLAKEVAP